MKRSIIYNIDPTIMDIYTETKRRKNFVATLEYLTDKKQFKLEYAKSYLYSKTAIAVGLEIPLSKSIHYSETLFPSLVDRIPSRVNPAYEDYCYQQGISVDETNPIILLATIGRRGPSTFVFEPRFTIENNLAHDIKQFRDKYKLSQWEVAQTFGLPELSISKIEQDKIKDFNLLHLVDIYLHDSAILFDRLKTTRTKIPKSTIKKIIAYCKALET